MLNINETHGREERSSFSIADSFVPSGRVLPRGTSRVHILSERSDLGLGKDLLVIRNVIKRNRSRGFLENEFFGNQHGEPSTTLQYGGDTLPDGSRWVIVGQPAGYFDESGLVVATQLPRLDNEALQRQQDEQVETTFSRNLPDSVRLAFVAAKLAGLYTALSTATPEQKSLVIEHVAPEVATPACSYPKSVPLPHATFGNVDQASYSFDNRNMSHHLRAEQRAMLQDSGLLPLLALHMYSYINAALRDTEFESREFEVAPRTSGDALGYEILYNIAPHALMKPENILFVAAVHDAQHDGFAAFNEQAPGVLSPTITGDGGVYFLKPQPASRNIMHIDHGVLTDVSSPNWYSYAGGMEASGTTLLRSPEFPQLHTVEGIEVFRSTAGANAKAVIQSLDLAA